MRATPSQLLGSHVAVGAATARSIGEEKSQAEAGDAEVPTRSLGGRHAGLWARGAGETAPSAAEASPRLAPQSPATLRVSGVKDGKAKSETRKPPGERAECLQDPGGEDGPPEWQQSPGNRANQGDALRCRRSRRRLRGRRRGDRAGSAALAGGAGGQRRGARGPGELHRLWVRCPPTARAMRGVSTAGRPDGTPDLTRHVCPGPGCSLGSRGYAQPPEVPPPSSAPVPVHPGPHCARWSPLTSFHPRHVPAPRGRVSGFRDGKDWKLHAVSRHRHQGTENTFL